MAASRWFIRGFVGASTVALLVVGCSSTTPPRRPPPVSQTRTTSAALGIPRAPVTVTKTDVAASVSTASAVARLSSAHCDHVAACNADTDVTPEERNTCMNEIGHSLVAAYPADFCAYGVSPGALEACKAAIDAEPCTETAAAPSLESLPTCSRDRLCVGSF